MVLNRRKHVEQETEVFRQGKHPARRPWQSASRPGIVAAMAIPPRRNAAESARVSMLPLLRLCLCAVLLAFAGATVAPGQDYGNGAHVVILGESLQARSRLCVIDRQLDPAVSPASVARCLARFGAPGSPLEALFALTPIVGERPASFWEQLREHYCDLMRDSGDALANMPADANDLVSAHPSVQVRRLCLLRLASLPAAQIAAYRERVDSAARRLLALGRQGRDPAPLRRLVDEMFCSRLTGEALDLLGDLAFERGDFDEARAWWRRVAPPLSDDFSALLYPGPSGVDRVRVQAKQILALAFAGRLVEAQSELARFHERHPTARGALAGTVGRYSEIVHTAIQQLVSAGIGNNADPWSTFAGTADRNPALTVCPAPALWEDGATWRVPLPPVDAPKPGRDRNGQPGSPRAPAFHPLIVGKQVLVADADSVTSYDLATGKQLFRYDLQHAGLAAGAPDHHAPHQCYTLTGVGDRVYARLGRQSLSARRSDASESSYLVCLDLAEPGSSDRPRQKWHVKAEPDQFFEGAPLVRAGRVYFAVSRLAGKRVTTAIGCYDSLGRLRWSRDVCTIAEFEATAAPRHRQHLLTWAGNQLVYCTHAGAVLAVDPWTGQTLWVVRYASRGGMTADHEASPREEAPCVHDDGRLFVAPLDSDRLYCLEACTGRVLWERDGLEVVNLLGSSQGRVLFTTRQGVHAVSAATGLPLWQQPSDGRLAGLGRGLIAGSWLLWPTRDAKLPLRGVTLAEGRQQKGDEENPYAEPALLEPTLLRHIPAGNVAFGNGCLVVAGTDELVAFVPRTPQPLRPAEPESRPHLQAE
jgi:outer membrane protein assembly factor BamB